MKRLTAKKAMPPAVRAQVKRFLRELETVQDLEERFDVTGVTINNWRLTRGLPVYEIPGTIRPAVRFAPGEVIAWAKRNNIPMVNGRP